MESLVLWSLKVWPARGLNNFISVASILRLCEALPAIITVQLYLIIVIKFLRS